jgi:hypothetical protein
LIQWKQEKLRVKVFFFLLTKRQREIEELKEKDGAKISSPISVGGSVGKRKQDDIQKLRNLEEQVGFKSHYDIRTSVSVTNIVPFSGHGIEEETKCTFSVIKAKTKEW